MRDLRVRWALEEAGLPYRTRLLAQGEQESPAYRALQPFGQVPVFEEDGLVLFESGAIVLHVGERSEALLPRDPAGRARARLRRPGAVDFARKRLDGLSAALGEKPFLDGETFIAGDLVMSTVLRILHRTDVVTRDRRLSAYVARWTGRPAFARALAAQLGDFEEAA